MAKDASLRLDLVEDPGSSMPARSLIGEYVHWVSDLAEETYGLHFDAEAMIATDLGKDSPFIPPSGRLYLVKRDNTHIGIAGLKRVDGDSAELLRMFVRPAARGLGAARLLLFRLIDDAREMGVSVIRLESLRELREAHTLYRSTGFREIPAYDTHSMAEFQPSEDTRRFSESVVFMELEL